THNGVAMAHYDGNGNWTQLDYVASLTPSQHPPGGIDTAPTFRLGESGTYIVNPNCTGSAEMVFAPPPGVRTGAVIKLMVVLSDQGRFIQAVVSSITPPGATGPAPAIIQASGRKVQPLNPDIVWNFGLPPIPCIPAPPIPRIPLRN